MVVPGFDFRLTWFFQGFSRVVSRVRTLLFIPGHPVSLLADNQPCDLDSVSIVKVIKIEDDHDENRNLLNPND